MRNGAAEAKFLPILMRFFAKSPCPDGFGEMLFVGAKFSFFGDQGDLFWRLHHISREEVPISRERVLPLPTLFSYASLYGMIRD